MYSFHYTMNSLINQVKSLHCTMNSLIYQVNSLHCTMNSLINQVNSLHCTMNSLIYQVNPLHCTMNILIYQVNSLHYTMNSLIYQVNSLNCTMNSLIYQANSLNCTMSSHLMIEPVSGMISDRRKKLLALTTWSYMIWRILHLFEEKSLRIYQLSTVSVEGWLLHNDFSSNRQSLYTCYTALLIQTSHIPRDMSLLLDVDVDS